MGAWNTPLRGHGEEESFSLWLGLAPGFQLPGAGRVSDGGRLRRRPPCREAPAALAVDGRALAPISTRARYSGGELKPCTVAAIRTALETARVIFVDENAEGLGVTLRKAWRD